MILTTKTVVLFGVVILADIAVASAIATFILLADMTEAGWIQLVTLVLAAIAPIAMIYVKARLDHVALEQKASLEKMNNIQHELNSRLDQWKKEAIEATKIAVAAAMARGKLEGKSEGKVEAKAEAPAEPTPLHMEVENMNVDTLNVPKKEAQ